MTATADITTHYHLVCMSRTVPNQNRIYIDKGLMIDAFQEMIRQAEDVYSIRVDMASPSFVMLEGEQDHIRWYECSDMSCITGLHIPDRRAKDPGYIKPGMVWDVCKSLVSPEPAPVVNEYPSVWDLVLNDMNARDQFGRNKHGGPLQPFNRRDALKDAYQEALDLVVYLRQALFERDKK